MERRGFLKALIGGVAVAAAVRTFPFRMYSFPSEIKVPKIGEWVAYNVKFTYPSITIFLNGIYQVQGADYKISESGVITMLSPPNLRDLLHVVSN